jgi:hypothetical protein
MKEQARQWIRPNRVHHRSAYRLAVRLGLLSTPSLDDAVTSGYGQPVLCPKGTSTPLLARALRRTLPLLWSLRLRGREPRAALVPRFALGYFLDGRWPSSATRLDFSPLPHLPYLCAVRVSPEQQGQQGSCKADVGPTITSGGYSGASLRSVSTFDIAIIISAAVDLLGRSSCTRDEGGVRQRERHPLSRSELGALRVGNRRLREPRSPT